MVMQEDRSTGSASIWKLLNTPISQLITGVKAQPSAGGGKEKAKELVLQGCIGRGTQTLYSVNGIDFAVQAETWIFGEVEYGAMAKVHCPIAPGRGRIASKIVITAPPA